MRAFQMFNFKNKNCSELLLTNGMGLDGAPGKFLTLVFLRPPTHHIQVAPPCCPVQDQRLHPVGEGQLLHGPEDEGAMLPAVCLQPQGLHQARAFHRC